MALKATTNQLKIVTKPWCEIPPQEAGAKTAEVARAGAAAAAATTVAAREQRTSRITSKVNLAKMKSVALINPSIDAKFYKFVNYW